jgi:AAA+ ATPase superfamily predicted ATPase
MGVTIIGDNSNMVARRRLALERDPDLIVDRDFEIGRLRDLLSRETPQLVLLYGRRRVGKTHMLSRMWGPQPAFYFTASETTPSQNRRALLDAYAEWAERTIHVEDYPTWRSVFRLLLDHPSRGPLVLVLDEFQYLGEGPKGLATVASELNAAWEMRRPKRRILLILAGSSVGMLEGLGRGGSPLYGRFSWQACLRPFSYWHAGELSGFPTLRDQAVAFGVFGGTPRYLSSIDPSQSLEDNIVRLVLHPSGEVRELVHTALLQEQGLRSLGRYTGILRAIGRGRTELNEIAQATGLEPGPALREKIERLIQLDYVQAGRNLGAKPKDPYRYRLSDPAMRFHYDRVAPLENALATQDPSLVWRRHIQPTLDAYMGHIFESMAEEAYYRYVDVQGLPVIREWGRWEGVDRVRMPVEVDIASYLVDGRVLTGAVKWNQEPLGPQVYTRHLEMLLRLSQAGVGWAHEALKPTSPLLFVAAGGFTERFERAAKAERQEVFLWNLEDLYR